MQQQRAHLKLVKNKAQAIKAYQPPWLQPASKRESSRLAEAFKAVVDWGFRALAGLVVMLLAFAVFACIFRFGYWVGDVLRGLE